MLAVLSIIFIAIGIAFMYVGIRICRDLWYAHIGLLIFVIGLSKDEWIQKQANRTDLIESMKYNLEHYNKSVVAAEKDTQWLKTFSESIKKVTE